QDGNRGYLLQAIIAGLNSLKDSSWETVSIEPDEQQEKVDIKWVGNDGAITVCQVKSTINNFDKADILAMLDDLINNAPNASKFELVLLGHFSSTTTKFFNDLTNHSEKEFGTKFKAIYVNLDKIFIERKAIDFDALDGSVNNKILEFLSSFGYRVSYKTLNTIGLALSANFSRFANDGRIVTRKAFEQLLLEWLESEYGDELEGAPKTLSLSCYKSGQLALTNRLEEDLVFYNPEKEDYYLDKINTLLNLRLRINAIDLPSRIVPSELNFEIIPMVSTPEGLMEYGGTGEYVVRKLTTIGRRILNIDLAPEFFNVGSLAKHKPTTTFLGLPDYTPHYMGQQDEIAKQEYIDEFEDLLLEVEELSRCWGELTRYRLIPLVLQNNGKEKCESIDVQLQIPSDIGIITHDNFPYPKKRNNIELIIDEGGLHLQLYHQKDSQVKAYPRSFWPIDSSFIVSPFNSGYFQKQKYMEGIIKTIFDYDLHSDVPGMQILECSFRSINPNDCIAFPSYLFLAVDKPLTLNYQIKSDNSSGCRGVLHIGSK
ncbi:MAG: hypothetical protein WC810_27155, partial [Janthinobacterium sp.]